MFSQQKTILITCGAGCSVSHTVQALKHSGYKVLILDNLIYGHRDLVEIVRVPLIVGDISDRALCSPLRDRALLARIFADYDISSVIHFAAFDHVGESVKHSAKYYGNNVLGKFTLLEAMRAAAVKQIVFFSTCATYGTAKTVLITEEMEQKSIDPYGMSKLSDLKTIMAHAWQWHQRRQALQLSLI